jgi:endonuclease/exonuclease/phosphatase family metal-dependent hydrolase
VQELSRGFHPTTASAGLGGGPSADQFAELAGLLPGYQLIEAVAADLPPLAPGLPRRQFGNAIASRLPVGRVIRHTLPWPADPIKPSMQRVALEAEVDAPFGKLRVITTHLEFYSAAQRLAQAEHLRTLHAEACGHAALPARSEKIDSPFADTERPAAAVVCGDFNSSTLDPAYGAMLASSAASPGFVDAWAQAHPGQPHAPTVGIYDHEQWQDGPYACDFVFVSEDLAPRIRTCEVDGVTAASDHQPIHLELS